MSGPRHPHPTEHEVLAAVAAVPAPAWSIRIGDYLRERDAREPSYSTFLTSIRHTLVELAGKGFVEQGMLKRSYGYEWRITDAGRRALGGER